MRRSLAACLLVFALASCAAPVLPLPPPLVERVDPPDATGLVAVSGDAVDGAFVACLNDRTEAGVIVRADLTSGAFNLRINAQIDDTLTLWQFDSSAPGGEQTQVVVPAP